MAINDNAVFTAATGYVYTAPVGTPAPTRDDLANFDPENFGITDASEWSPIGHTGEDDLPEFGYEGGDTETRGTWQKKQLREVSTDDPVDYMTLKPLQFDEETLELYYGPNKSEVEGVYAVDSTAEGGIERALLVIMVDGLFKIGHTAAKVSIRRDESISLASDEFSVLPIRATYLKHSGRHLFEWILPAE